MVRDRHRHPEAQERDGDGGQELGACNVCGAEDAPANRFAHLCGGRGPGLCGLIETKRPVAVRRESPDLAVSDFVDMAG